MFLTISGRYLSGTYTDIFKGGRWIEGPKKFLKNREHSLNLTKLN